MAGRVIAHVDNAEYYGIDEGADAPLIFLHGVMTDHSVWERQASRLSTRFRTICPDFRGHGDTAGECTSLSVRRLADDLITLVAAMSLEAPIVIGWSLGASVALVACMRGLSVEGVVLVSATPQLFADETFPFALAADAARARDAGLRHNFEKNARLFGAMVSPEDAKVGVRIADMAARASKPAALSIFDASWRESLVSRLHEVTAPAFLIHGADDRICSPRAAEYLSSHLPIVSGIRMIKGAGHAPFLTKPELFDLALDEALSNFAPCTSSAN